MANDSDIDSGTLTAILGTNVSNGSLTLNSDGSFDYAPNANFNGTDGFTYTANDGNANSNIATVTINVTAVNDPPTANNDPSAGDNSFETDENTAFTTGSVLANTSEDGAEVLSSGGLHPQYRAQFLESQEPP